MMEFDDYIATLKRLDRSLEALVCEQRRGSDCNPRTQLLEVADRSELALQANAERDGFALYTLGPGDIRWAGTAQGASDAGMVLQAVQTRARSIIVPDPAAGTDWVTTIPTGQIWRIQALQARLVTSAVVATRFPSLHVDDGAAQYWSIQTQANQAASLTRFYSFAPIGALGPVSTAYGSGDLLPNRLIMPAGHRIGPLTSGVQAGDQWSQITLLIEDLSVAAGVTNPYMDRGPHPYRGPVFVQASLPNTRIIVIEWTRASRAG